MIVERSKVAKTANAYDPESLTIACVGSHSALDVCDGAAEEGVRTLVLAQKGRERTYTHYYKSEPEGPDGPPRGTVDDCWVLDRYADVVKPDIQARLRKANAVFVPNRALTSYAAIEDVEGKFEVPLFGSRRMLRLEERGQVNDYYHLLAQADIPFPDMVVSPDDIDGLVIVKLHHAQKKLERGFFTAATAKEFREKSQTLIKQGVITAADLKAARIERYIIGPVFNLNMFYSPLASRRAGLELLGVDWRFESSLDGHVRLPASQQLALPQSQAVPEYTVVGHNSATLRESLLEKAFELGEKFVTTARENYAPGIIGPFCLQTCVDKDMKFFVYDVAPRIGGGTNIHTSVGHPYGNALWRKPMSTGRRIAQEIKRAAAEGKLSQVVT